MCPRKTVSQYDTVVVLLLHAKVGHVALRRQQVSVGTINFRYARTTLCRHYYSYTTNVQYEVLIVALSIVALLYYDFCSINSTIYTTLVRPQEGGVLVQHSVSTSRGYGWKQPNALLDTSTAASCWRSPTNHRLRLDRRCRPKT